MIIIRNDDNQCIIITIMGNWKSQEILGKMYGTLEEIRETMVKLGEIMEMFQKCCGNDGIYNLISIH